MAVPDFRGYSDIVMHSRETVNGIDEERIVFPITRYDNILNAPHLTTDPSAIKNAEFVLFETESMEMSQEDIFKLYDKTW